MAHLTDVKYINSENIPRLIDMFDRCIYEQYGNVDISVLVVGGSALAIKHSFRSAVDIDCDIKFSHDTQTGRQRE